LDFLVGFFACLYSGMLAVPATYPKPKRPMPRLSAIAKDCAARIALCTSQTLAMVEAARTAPELQSIRWIAIDTEVAEKAEDQWRPPRIDRDWIAFLQYTSGSTSEPKGVMVSHGNLMSNLEMIRRGFDIQPGPPGQLAGVGVTWLPAYHDMGLIGGLLEPLYVGGCVVLMSPAAFLQRPARWLKAISDYRAVVSGAPNFAYELCVRKVTDEQKAELDLRSWRTAFCGAEPIRTDTMRRFLDKFGPCGFRENAFYPCYGLAEATLLAAGGDGPGPLVVHRVLRSELLEHRAVGAGRAATAAVQELVGCGHSPEGEELAIVEPQRLVRAAPGQIGEIWLKGPNVARGYWNRAEENREVFAAHLADTGEGPFVRTGDLGFIRDGHLFVTGRLKDLIIIRGRNHYPQDIERTAERADEALLPGSGAAFSVERDGQEELVIVHEVDRRYRHADFDQVARRIRARVAEEHELEVNTVVLIREGNLPRTTSGKVQRGLCRERYLLGELRVLFTWQKAEAQAGENGRMKPASPPAPPAIARPNGRPLNEAEIHQMAERIESWLLEWLVERGLVPADQADRDRPFADYGIDSLAAVELSGELQRLFQVELTPVVAWNYPTPAALARYLAQQIGGVGAQGPEAASAGAAAPAPAPEAAVDEFERLLTEIEDLDEEEAEAALNETLGRERSEA
jgi:acyl-CoA synthetase (AMP-forming)/AMP-acid ligase II/acyl carrier protein